MTPKPPTVRNVSATLRAAGFRATSRERSEGYEVMWWSDINRINVYAAFIADDGDDSTAAHIEADKLQDKALGAMTVALERKGWRVERPGSYLVVKERR